MTDRTSEPFKAVLQAIADVAPESPALSSVPPKRSVRRRPALVAGAAFVAVLLIVGLGALVIRQGREESRDVATVPGVSLTTTSTSLMTTPATAEPVRTGPLPRYTIDLVDWSVVEVSDSASSTVAILGQNTEDGGGGRAIISVWSDNPGDPPGTGYQTALAAANADGEHLGGVDINARTVEAFADRYGGEATTDYQFLWQNTGTITVEVVVFTDDFEDAKRIVTSIAPITEESWTELVAQFAPTAASTTTMPANPPATEPEPVAITTTTMP